VVVLTQVVLAATSGAAITFCIMTGSLLTVVDSTCVTATSEANAGTTAATAATIAALNANAFFITVISPRPSSTAWGWRRQLVDKVASAALVLYLLQHALCQRAKEQNFSLHSVDKIPG
jgi:hypothetical protein